MPWQRSFHLKVFSDFWRISPVYLHSGYAAIELQKELADEGDQKDLLGWDDYVKRARSHDFVPGSSQMHHALVDLLCQNEDHPRYRIEIEKIRSFLEQKLQQQPLSTRSLAMYSPMPSPDNIFHLSGQRLHYVPEHLFGVNGYFHNIWDGDRMSFAILGEEDLQRTNHVYQWLSKKDTHLERNNKKKSSLDMGWVSLGITSSSFNIKINVNVRDRLPALGMRVRGFHKIE